MKQKFANALSLALIVAMLFTSVALADNTVADGDGLAPYADNNLSLGTVCAGSTTIRTIPVFVTRQGAAGSTNVFKDSSTVTVSVLSVTGSGLSAVMDSSNTIALPSNWGSVSNNTQSNTVSSTVTFVAGAAGSFSGSISYRGSGVNSSNSTINRDDSMTVTATVEDCTPPDTTAPTAAPTQDPAANANGWNNTDVTVYWNWTDEEGGSGIDPANCTTSSTSSGEGLLTLNAECYDLAGNQGTASVDVKVDQTAPTILFVGPSTSAWYNANVTANWSCTDATSGPVSTSVSAVASGEGNAVPATGTCVDNAGLSAGNTQYFMIDLTAPIITDNGPTFGPNGSNGWYISAVANQFSADGAISGLADPSKASFQVSSGSVEGPSVTVSSGSVSDNAGNTATGITSAAFKIDLSDPSLTCASTTPTFLLNQSGAQVTASVSDTISGPASATASAVANTSSVGLKSVNITGYDNAGRSKTVSCSYNVTYNFSGFFQPVDNNILNLAKAGQAIPLKWRLTDANGSPVLNLANVRVTVASLTCSSGVTADEVEEYAAGSSGLQNLGDGYYQFNWKTPTTYANSCKTMNLDIGDGIPHIAKFQFKR